MMRVKEFIVSICLLLLAETIFAQQSPFERLPLSSLDIHSPAMRVDGELGNMRIRDSSCRDLPQTAIRRRIVNAAIQEWAYFGFHVNDQTNVEPPLPAGFKRKRSRYSKHSSEEMERIASSIAGYWSSTSEGTWILARQNDLWKSVGVRSRWGDAWSAAFISWVMCESGVNTAEQFERDIAHRTYIDQAIRARDGLDGNAIYSAYDLGETMISPGDLLCRGSRPRYQNIAQRRQQLGEGARTHCDIVVKIDEENQQIMAIGGNVGETVSMKVLAAGRQEGKYFLPTISGRRALFAHLKLKYSMIENDALQQSPTLKALVCTNAMPVFGPTLNVNVQTTC